MMQKSIKIGTTVTLTQAEIVMVKVIAQARYANNRKNDVTNLKVGEQSNEFTDSEGFGAEMAFCKLFNLYPDFLIECRSSKNNMDKGDAELHISNGVVDIKSTKYPNGRLISSVWKKTNTAVNLFSLMVGELPTYVFKGFMRSEDLLQKQRIKDLGYGPNSLRLINLNWLN